VDQSSNKHSGHSGRPVYQIALIVVGACVFTSLVVFALIYWRRYTIRKNRISPPTKQINVKSSSNQASRDEVLKIETDKSPLTKENMAPVLNVRNDIPEDDIQVGNI